MAKTEQMALATATPVEDLAALQVYKAIAMVAAALARTGITKDRTNQQQGFKFRGIDDVYYALAPLLAEHSLCIIPRVTERTCTERTTQKGGVLFYVTVRVEFDLVSALDGSKHTACMYGEAMDSGDKATNKALSVAYKMMAFQTFCIPTEGDNDPDATTHDVAGERAAPPDVIAALRSELSAASIPIPTVCQTYGVETLEELTPRQVSDAHRRLEEHRRKRGGGQ